MEHVNRAVVVCRIFCKISDKLHISKPWNSWSSIQVACEKDGKECIDIKIIFPSSMFECLLSHRCKNLAHKH